MKALIITLIIVLIAAGIGYYGSSSYYEINLRPMGLGDSSYKIEVDTTTHKVGDIVWFARIMVDSTKQWGQPALVPLAEAVSDSVNKGEVLPMGMTKLYERGMIMKVSKKIRFFSRRSRP